MARWGGIIKAWIGHGYNPGNVGGMLECFERDEAPGNSRAKGRDSPRNTGSKPMPIKRTIAALPKGWLQEGDDEDGNAILHETPG